MQQILSTLRKAIEEYNMIKEGDKIAVCLSGGKDSITLLHALKALQRFYPKHFELIAISIYPGFEFFVENFLQKIYHGSVKELLLNFIEEKEMTEKDIEELMKEIKK